MPCPYLGYLTVWTGADFFAGWEKLVRIMVNDPMLLTLTVNKRLSPKL
jgi:hypothetical protein